MHIFSFFFLYPNHCLFLNDVPRPDFVCLFTCLQGLLNVTDGELKDAGIEDATHRETILNQLSKQRERMDPHYGEMHSLDAFARTHKGWEVWRLCINMLIKY